MAAAVLFGAIHALMPGHGKTVLVSYHLGQPAKLTEGVVNGAILAQALRKSDPAQEGRAQLTHNSTSRILPFFNGFSGLSFCALKVTF